MARDVRDVWAYRDRMRTKQNEQRPGMFQGTNYVTGTQLDAQDAQRRELEMQALKNKGQFDVADRTQTGGLAIADRQETGATKRTGLTEGGALQRLGMTEGGLNQRFQETHSLARDRLGYEQEDAQAKNRLRLFEHLDKTNPITGQSEFASRRDNYNLYSMTPDAQAALNERMRGNLGLAGDDTSINTSINTGNEDQRLLPRDPEYADYHRYQRAQKRALDQSKIPPRPSPNYIPIY